MPEKQIHNRNYCIDFLKGIACICVVFMHCEFPGKFGILVQCISRFCVPFFFMVSGFFAYREETQYICSPPQYRKILHILKITIFASLFYFVIEIIKNLLFATTIDFSKSSVLYWILFNKTFVIPSPLWFLFALLYVYIFYAFVQKLNLYKFAYISIPILIFGYIVLAQGMHLIGKNIPNMIYKNFLFEGFPFFMLGHFLHYKEEKICNYFKNIVLLILFIVFTLMCVLERFLLGRDFGVNICTFPQVICLFILGMKNASLFENNILRKLGTNLSMFIYIFHPFVWHTMEYGYRKLQIDGNIIALYLKPIFVLISTIVLSICLYFIITTKKKKDIKVGLND